MVSPRFRTGLIWLVAKPKRLAPRLRIWAGAIGGSYVTVQALPVVPARMPGSRRHGWQIRGTGLNGYAATPFSTMAPGVASGQCKDSWFVVACAGRRSGHGEVSLGR
jgi:hypothetical protein